MQPRHTNVLEGGTETAAAPSTRRAPARSAGTKSPSREKTVDLTFQQPNARSVCVAGTFNNWDHAKTPMRREAQDSIWKVSLPLKPGRYEYRFVVDGQWISDPNAKESATNDFGSSNSVLVV
jgi:1,4-alpha-glucan branching enzyme